ncbi:unnamed protein product (macronuclear) [Paramecium tetraurelia]|uniref:Transmembrane protein n=1 Tax=Paramecium tetraurelia TaxID=5888 RepID=A0DSE7_PARTE|nr:uncharacterized protein GSPATT00019668001 [Paramecium tetraurelia]CAK85964.1 unnamed protein product [Paramecium tetraurelia]|eukprot:XP_001453361.1 hypothetical protein (macronuclear) [Paramecium tetraurelia strain d4-2]
MQSSMLQINLNTLQNYSIMILTGISKQKNNQQFNPILLIQTLKTFQLEFNLRILSQLYIE